MTTGRITTLALSALLVGTGVLVPAAPAQAGPEQRPALRAGPGGPPGARAGRERRARLGKALGLSEEQRERVKALMGEHRDAMEAARQARKGASQDLKAVREARRAALGDILTPEQREHMQRILKVERARRGQRAQPPRADRKPQGGRRGMHRAPAPSRRDMPRRGPAPRGRRV